MSKIAIVENGAVYEGYDSINAIQWCSPSFLGCSVCVSASAVKGMVTISVGFNTPFGNVSKTFNFNSNVSYTWQPLSRFKLTISITNFNEAGGVFSFDLAANPCVEVPIMGWKCFMFSHHFEVPLVLTGIQNDIDDSQFASVLAFHSGNGFDEASGSSLLKGDIYNNYLNQANIFTIPPVCKPTIPCMPTIPQVCSGLDASIPTLPVVSCIPIPTRQCVPTITSCVTGIPFICNSAVEGYPTTLLPGCQHVTTLLPGCQHPTTLLPGCQSDDSQVMLSKSNTADAAVPTLPVASCIPTRQCVPTITSCVTGIPFICNSALQGSFPTTLLPNCHHVTTLLPGCQSGGVQGTANIPTIPVASCLPTRQCIPTITSCVTGIPFVCNGVQQSGYPTTLLPGCQHVTTLLPGCLHPTTLIPGCQSGDAQNVNAAALPTLPVSSCVNTAGCVPSLPCVPSMSCTGIPIIC